MTLAFASYTPTIQAVQYTSSNGPDIVAYINAAFTATVATLSGGVIFNPVQNMSVGDWLAQSPGNPVMIYTAAVFAANNSTPGGTAAMSGGKAPLSLSGGANQNVTVPLDVAMVDTNYTARAWMENATTVGGQLVTGTATPIDAGHVSVPVSNTALLTLNSGTVVVSAFHK